MNIAALFEPQVIAMILAAVGAATAVLTIAMPMLDSQDLNKRMKSVALEREAMRARERERMSKVAGKGNLRSEAKGTVKQVVERFKLTDWLQAENARDKLAMAGYRGAAAEYAFLFFRLVTPIALFFGTLFYVFVAVNLQQSATMKLLFAAVAAFVGIKAPEIFLSNKISKRQASIKKAFPDALDLLLICVESGMSIEHAFRRVSQEIGSQSIELAEELALATAELSFLPERRVAYENLAKRTGLEGVKAVSMALVQAERYGTPLGTALRVLAQENRDQRMNAAEKKAAALPPKLTVPMIVFFLPVLFVVILMPVLVQAFKWK
jgi:tight adherence protein C